MRRITSAVSSGSSPCIGCTLATASTGLTLRTRTASTAVASRPDPAASSSPSSGEPGPVGPATTSDSGVPARDSLSYSSTSGALRSC